LAIHPIRSPLKVASIPPDWTAEGCPTISFYSFFPNSRLACCVYPPMGFRGTRRKKFLVRSSSSSSFSSDVKQEIVAVVPSVAHSVFIRQQQQIGPH
jgi:hypothetical protein